MGKMQRDKGARRERQIVQMCQKAGIKAERVPLSGAMEFRNTRKKDVDVYAMGQDEAPFGTEVKARGNGEGFTTIKRWLSDADALFLIEDHQAPLVVLPFEQFIRLCRR